MEKLKNIKIERKTLRIALLILGIILLLLIAFLFNSCGKKEKVEPSETVTETVQESTTEKQLEIGDIETTSEKETTEPSTTKQAESFTKKNEPTTVKRQEPTTKKQEPATRKQEPATRKTEPTTTKREESTTRKQESTTKRQETTTKRSEPTTEKSEPKTTDPRTTEPTTAEPAPIKYSCGAANHKCKTAEDHAFLTSIEAKGCPICGSHSCKSFYAIDEWGNQSYDITKCPQYAEEEDPAVVCEHCGRECGLGDNGTCVRFTVDTECPICGKMVKAKTSHTH